ncbi:MAG: Rrf2 family transcriptional regulator [Balneolaceae bacterium]
MFLNQTSHYALRAITGLVTTGNSEPVSAKDLARQVDVPVHYLSKIMRKMVEAGYVISKKGHGGGFVLDVDPEKLQIIDVLTAAGFDIDKQPCVFGWETCSNDKPCPLHPVWKRLKQCFNDWACHTSFEEIRLESAKIEPPSVPFPEKQ